MKFKLNTFSAASALVVAVLCVFGLLLITSRSDAQGSGGNGFSISKLVQRFPDGTTPRSGVQPGEQLDFTVNVTNVTNEVLTSAVEFNNFVPRDETGSPKIISNTSDEGAERGLRDYFVPVENFELQPGQSREVSVSIDLPQNISPGGHFGVVRFTSVGNDTEETVALSASVGTLVLVNVDGDIVEDASLLELGAQKDEVPGSFFQSGPLAVYARIQNNGNAFVSPYGTIKVTDFFGRTVDEFEFNENRGSILPDSIRKYEQEIQDRFFFGRYTIEANLAYGAGGGSIITADASFWVLPWRIVVAAIAVLAILILAIRFFLKSYAKKIEKRSKRRY